MEAIYREIILPTKSTEFTIIALGDFHIGHINHDEHKLAKILRQFAKQENTYFLLTGDYVDKREPKHKYYDPGQQDPKIPTEHNTYHCYQRFEELIKPIKNNIIGMHIGNHDMDGDATHYVKDICKRLKIPFLGYKSILILNPQFEQAKDERPWIISSMHGSGGGRKTGAKINRIEDEAQNTEADFYIQGHNHYLSYTTRIKICPRRYKNSVKIHEREMYFVNAGSFLKSYQLGNYCYSEKANYPPQQTGCVEIRINPCTRKVKIYLTT